jgi:hypothetical protein
MRLPASQYSVLDAKQIERIDEDTFCCYVGGLRFFNFVIEPVLTVSVTVTDMGPTVKLLSTKVRVPCMQVWMRPCLRHCMLVQHGAVQQICVPPVDGLADGGGSQ